MINKIKHLIKLYKQKYSNKKSYIVRGKYDLLYHIDPISALDYHIIQHGILQDWIAINLEKLVRKDAIVFDIGANSGLLSLPFAKKHVPQGKVFSFEPDLEIFNQLKRNVEINALENIVLEAIALQDNQSIKELEFFQRRAVDGEKLINRGLSSLEEINLHRTSSYIVKCSTIDLFVEENCIERIDFIKIDVEGSEYRVLIGGINTIEQFLPIIQYEYSTTIDTLTNNDNTIRAFNLLKKLGFLQYCIENEKRLIQITQYNSTIKDCNVLAIHESNKLISI